MVLVGLEGDEKFARQGEAQKFERAGTREDLSSVWSWEPAYRARYKGTEWWGPQRTRT